MDNRGFTLIELILTIAILSIIIMIVVPKANNNSYLNSISKELLYDIRDLRTKSMTTDEAFYFMIIAKNRYYIIKTSSKKGRKTIKFVDLKPNYTLSSSNSNSNQKIEFNYNGKPRYSTTITLTNTKTKDTKQISIVPDTGRILLIE